MAIHCFYWEARYRTRETIWGGVVFRLLHMDDQLKSHDIMTVAFCAKFEDVDMC